jgi:hypothetical protein
MSGSQEAIFIRGSFRQSLIDKQVFYLEQARKRLFSQFDDIEAESKQGTRRAVHSEFMDRASLCGTLSRTACPMH